MSTLALVFYSWNKTLNCGFQGVLAHCGHEFVGQKGWRQSWDLGTSVACWVWIFLQCFGFEMFFLSLFLLRVRLGGGVKVQVGFVSFGTALAQQ